MCSEQTARAVDVAAPVASWLGEATCSEAIASLRAMTPAPARILVVDNGSGSGIGRAIVAAHPGVELLVLAENQDVAVGRNVGLRHLLADAGVRYVLQLDDAAVVPPDCLQGLRAALEADHLFDGRDGRLTVIDLDAVIAVTPGCARRYRFVRWFDLLTLLLKLEPLTTAAERAQVRRVYAEATGLPAPTSVPRPLRYDWARRQVHLVRRACTATGLVQ